MLWNSSLGRIETADSDVDYIGMRIILAGERRPAVCTEIASTVLRGIEYLGGSVGISEVFLGNDDPGYEGCCRGAPAHGAMAVGSGVGTILKGITNRSAETTSRYLNAHRLLSQ